MLNVYKLNVNQTHNVRHWFILFNGVHELYCLLVVFIYINLIVP
jgi:hypothetical protein